MMELIRDKSVYLLIASVFTWFVGMILSYTSDLSSLMVFDPATSLFLITISVFSFSFFFFGFGSPVIMFLSGVFFGRMARTNVGLSLVVGVGIAASFLACYAAIRLGTSLLDDLVGKGNFKFSLKTSLLILTVSLLLSAIIDVT